MATYAAEVGHDQLYHFVVVRVWDSAPLEPALMKRDSALRKTANCRRDDSDQGHNAELAVCRDKRSNVRNINVHCGSNNDAHPTRHADYAVSPVIHKADRGGRQLDRMRGGTGADLASRP
jgi:hypothetical protein